MRRPAAVLCLVLLLASWPRQTGATLIVPPSPVASYPVGQNPFGLVADPTDGRVYVANTGRTTLGTTISVVEPVSGTVSSIQTSKPSELLALDSAGRRLYTSNFDSTTNTGSFDEIDLTTRAVVATLGVGGLGVALDAPSSRVFVSDGRTLSSVDTSTFAVVSTRSAPIGELWFGVAIDPGLRRVYVTNGDSSHPSVVVLDESDLSTLAEISLSTVPRFAIAVDTVTHRVFVGGFDPSGPPFAGSSVYAIEGVALTIAASATVRGFPGGIALAPSTHRVYVSDMYGHVLLNPPGYPINELDSDTLAPTLTLSSPGQPALAVFGADGRLYVTRQDGAAVDAYDLTPRNVPPVIDSVTVTPTEAKTNDVLTAHVVAHDPNGDTITIAYQWYVNTTNVAGQQQPIPGETSATLDLSKPGNGDRDNLICLTVTVSDGQLTTVGANCWLFVQDSPPIVSVSLAPTVPATNSVLRATALGVDPDGDAITYTFTWKLNGAVRRAATTSANSDTFDLAIAGAQKGDTVSLEVVARDDLLSGTPSSASAVIANTAPTASVTLNNTNPKSADTLVATASGFDADHDPLTYTYAWGVNRKVKQVTVTTSTSDVFNLRSNDVHNGDVVTVSLTASDGSAVSAPSSASAVVGKN